jgi:hypothetical protein
MPPPAVVPEPAPGPRATAPPFLLRMEGLALLVAALVVWSHVELAGWILIVTLLLPDLGLLGYALGPMWGARVYNLTHTLALPLILGARALHSGTRILLAAAVVWAAHIGMDRTVGFGLKYPDSFRRTHLQRLD